MRKEFQVRITALLLGLFTVAVIIFAWLNFQQERRLAIPNDGIWWVEKNGRLEAERVHPQGPGERAGVKPTDELVSVNGAPVAKTADLIRQLYKKGVYAEVKYELRRGGVPLEVQVVLVPADTSLNIGLRLIALTYLSIGFFVLLRRWTAPKSAHFYIFCLVSFVFYAFKYTGKFNAFDWTIYWSNVVAWLLQPALFLHFALTFPEERPFLQKHRWANWLIYAPGSALLTIHLVAFKYLDATGLLLFRLDQMEWSYLTLFFAFSAWVLWQSYERADTPLLRQQMKWVTRGTIFSIAPFTIFYVLPTLLGDLPTPGMKLSVLSLIFLPLTFGYAIVRYRLMDVDYIFKRGMVYTLATASVVGLYFGLVALIVQAVGTQFPLGNWGLVAAIVITALLFDPIKSEIQDRLDRLFDRKRYDYRRTLLDFGRELGAETDLSTMLTAVVDRVAKTLLVDRIAVILASQMDAAKGERFFLAKSSGISYLGDLDFSFLSEPRDDGEPGHIFFDNTRVALREPHGAQITIAQLDLNYYIPCRVQGRTIAVLGLGKTSHGDFLSSDDVELLETLSGYIAIAIQNALLYASLEQKVNEYERLKEYNENIVESINVGVLAVDLEDRVESWNAQMEVMYATPREQARGRELKEIFPPEFMHAYDLMRNSPGIHNLYKFRLSTPAGENKVANIAIAPLITREHASVGRLIIVDDITERVSLETSVAQAEKLSSIGVLAAGVAHEVNTPLAVISSYAQMLAKQLQGDEKLGGLLDKITKQTFRASEIVNNLLNFSRTSGTEFSELDIAKVIGDTLGLLEHQFRTARIKVERAGNDSMPMILGNAGKLQQVFLNLFLNAKDAMPDGGTLRIETANNGSAQVIIRDTGSGIASEHLGRIFDPFFTTKNGNGVTERRGTGLGLAVTYGIIQEHGGKVHVESRVGAGTIFTLEFPVLRARKREATATTVAEA